MYFCIKDEVSYQGVRPATRLAFSIRAEAHFGVLHTALIVRVIETSREHILPLRPRRVVDPMSHPYDLRFTYADGKVKYCTKGGLELDGEVDAWFVSHLFVLDTDNNDIERLGSTLPLKSQNNNQ